jgi:hypothetical protein
MNDYTTGYNTGGQNPIKKTSRSFKRSKKDDSEFTLKANLRQQMK